MRTVVVDGVDERLDGVVVRVPVAHAEQVGDLLLVERAVAVEVELVELDPERLLLRQRQRHVLHHLDQARRRRRRRLGARERQREAALRHRERRAARTAVVAVHVVRAHLGLRRRLLLAVRRPRQLLGVVALDHRHRQLHVLAGSAALGRRHLGGALRLRRPARRSRGHGSADAARACEKDGWVCGSGAQFARVCDFCRKILLVVVILMVVARPCVGWGRRA